MTIHVIMEPDAAPCARDGLRNALKRRAGGPYGWLTPHLAAMAAHNASIAARILSLPRDELHFIAMALAFMGDARGDLLRVEALARAVGRDRREAIIAQHAPGFDPKLARLAGKLAGRPWRAASYLRLAALHREPHARKTLAHLRAVTRRDVLILTRLPPDYRTRGVIKMIRRPSDLSRLLFAIEIVRRVRTDLTDRQILASLERTEMDRIRHWVEAHYERLPFPSAPTPILTDGRGGALRPVATGADLRRAGADYDNCVRNYIARAANGGSVFYRYERGERRIAVVELRPVPGLGWAIDELAGPGNAPLEGENRQRIIETFAAAGVSAAPQARSRFGWFDLE